MSKEKVTLVAMMMTFTFLALGSFAFTLLLLYYYPAYAQQKNNNNTNKLSVADGIASGDVTDHSAIIWSRATTQALMHVQYDTTLAFSHPKSTMVSVNQTTDFAGHVKLDSLSPDTVYYYRVWFSSSSSTAGFDNKTTTTTPLARATANSSMTGTFRTAPDHHLTSSKPVSFVVGGDLGGQSYCRRVGGGVVGYPIFSIMRALSPDFFVFNGDQIYGDNTCSAKGPSNVTGWTNIEGNFPSVTDNKVNWTNQTQLQDVYNKHWEYNRADPHLQSLLRNTSMYSQADDHEVINDYGGKWSYWTNATKGRSGFPNVVKAGVNAFFDFSPIDRSKVEPNRIYRSFHWGKDLDLFILDMHSYRSRNDLADTPENNKTLLGKDQLHWLEQSLLNSTTSWKVISADVPTTIPNCFNKQLGCDNWATNSTTSSSSTFKKTFTRERSDFLKFLDDHNIKNVVVVATDVHFPTNILVEDDPNHDGHKLIYYELVSGPLSAIPLKVNPLDPTINATSKYQENKIFNFGYIKLQKEKPDGKVHLIAEVLDADGLVRPGSNWDLSPQ
ncbi:MAG: alkaline phosphatase D family protein [Nitrososphaeraceae archaeon]